MPNVSSMKVIADREKTAAIINNMVLDKFEEKKPKKPRNIETIRLRRDQSFRSTISKPILFRTIKPSSNALSPPDNEPAISNWEIPEVPPFKSVSNNRIKHFSENGKKTEEITENEIVIELFNWKGAKHAAAKDATDNKGLKKKNSKKEKKQNKKSKGKENQNGNNQVMNNGQTIESSTIEKTTMTMNRKSKGVKKFKKDGNATL